MVTGQREREREREREPDIHRHLETGGHQLPASAAGINNSNLNIDILPR